MVKKIENEPKNKGIKKTKEVKKQSEEDKKKGLKEIDPDKIIGLSIISIKKEQTHLPEEGERNISNGSLCDALASKVNEDCVTENVPYFRDIPDNLSETTNESALEPYKNIKNTSMYTLNNIVTLFEGINDFCREAKSIHTSGQMASYMTVFCVALLDVNGYIKKFAFHNKSEKMTPDCRNRATELGYDVIQADQSHAEIQFIQFILKRNLNKIRYTHIVGMGCSQRHCQECDSMLRMVLGKDYTDFSAVTLSKCTNEVVKNCTEDKCILLVTFEILHGTKTVKPEDEQNSTTKNFYLPPVVRDLIGSYLSIKTLTFGTKYDKQKKEDEKKEEGKEDKKKKDEKKVFPMVCYY